MSTVSPRRGRRQRGSSRSPLAVLGLLPLVLAVGCTSKAPAQNVEAVATPIFTSNADAPSNAATLNVTSSGQLGKIVVDREGFTLYRFDKDTAKPPKANCAGSCALTWLPVPGDDPGITVQGINQSLVGQVQRADETSQLTLGGWPLYRYAQDHKPGDTAGQGQQGAWFAITPDGKKAGSP
ncbi:hypothetical protein [Kutzneria albida]|uniref:hypothetical protein n=1 Tax=Kutzneria albida TaxID=43357 RepID=UPI0009DDD63B|nr:hypothetical protein [Kutzneria albida]